MNRTSPSINYNEEADSLSPGVNLTAKTNLTPASIEPPLCTNEGEHTSNNVAEFDTVQQRHRHYMTCSLPPRASKVRQGPDASDELHQKLQKQLLQRLKETRLKAGEEQIQPQRQAPWQQQYNKEHQQGYKEQLLETGQNEIGYLRQIHRQQENQKQHNQEHQQQQEEHQRQLFNEDRLKVGQEQKYVQPQLPRNHEKPNQQSHTGTVSVAGTHGDVCSETNEKESPHVKSAVLDAQSYRVSVKSLVRKLSDTGSQNRCLRGQPENTRQSHRHDVPEATQIPVSLNNPRDAGPQLMGSLPAGHEKTGVDTVGVVKGGVASLISKFQGQAQLSGATRLMFRKSGLTSGRDLKSITSVSCESTDSGIQSNLADNPSCSAEVSKVSLRSDSENAAAVEWAPCRTVSSPGTPRKTLNIQKECRNLVSLDSEPINPEVTHRLLPLRSPNNEGQTDIRMSTGVSASERRDRIMEQSKERPLECFCDHFRDVEFDRSNPHCNSTPSDLRLGNAISDQFCVGEKCSDFTKLGSVDSNTEKMYLKTNEYADSDTEKMYGKTNKYVDIANLHSRTEDFIGNSHVSKGEDGFLSRTENVKLQEINVCGDCVAKGFESLKISSLSEKKNSCESLECEHGNSENYLTSMCSALSQSLKMCQCKEERTEMPINIPRKCESKKCELSLVSKSHVIASVKPMETSDSVKEIPKDNIADAMSEQSPHAHEENPGLGTTVIAETDSSRPRREGDANNHGKEVGSQGHPRSSDTQTLCSSDNLKTLEDLDEKAVQPNIINDILIPTQECGQNYLGSEQHKEETKIVSNQEHDIPFPETVCNSPDILPQQDKSLTVITSGKDILNMEPVILLTAPAKFDAATIRSQKQRDSKQTKAQVVNKFDMYNAHFRANPLAKSLISKHKWTHAACPTKTEIIKPDTQSSKGESPKREQQLGFSVFAGPRREPHRRPVRKPVFDRLEHSDKPADVKSHKKNMPASLRQVSPVALRQSGNLASQDIPRVGALPSHLQKQNLRITQSRNLKSSTVNSLSGQNGGRFAVRNNLKAVRHEGLQASHYHGIRKQPHSSEPLSQNTVKASEVVPFQPMSSINSSPKGVRKSDRVQLNGPLWTNNAVKMGVFQRPTRNVRMIGTSGTSTAKGGHCKSSSSYHNRVHSELGDDASQICKKPFLRPAVVKSDMSACNSMKTRAISIRRNGHVAAKRPLLDTSQPISFTKMYRSGSPLVSHRTREGNSNKSGVGSGPLSTYYCPPRTDLKQGEPRGPANEPRRANTGDGIRRTKLSVVPAIYRRHSLGKGLHPFLNVEEAKQVTELKTVVKNAQSPIAHVSKRTSPSTYFNSKTLSRSKRDARTVKQGQETVKTFHKYSSTYFSNTNQISQSVTEEAREVKECCIVLNSLKEAESVANCLMASACSDFTPLRWDSERNCPQDQEAIYDMNASSDSEEVMKRLEDFDVYKSDIAGCSSEKCFGSPQNRNKRSPQREAKGPVMGRVAGQDRLRHESCLVSKWKHSRKPFASLGEINLLDPRFEVEEGQTSQVTAVMPNVRRINIQPMICIPWNESIEHSRNIEYRDGQNQPADHCVSVPEEYISKTTSFPHSPDLIFPSGQRSAQVPTHHRARSAGAYGRKDTQRVKAHRPYNQRTIGHIRSSACSEIVTTPSGHRLFDQKKFHSEREEGGKEPGACGFEDQQTSLESSPIHMYRSRSIKSSPEPLVEMHGALRDSDFNVKSSFVSPKPLTSTISNNPDKQTELSDRDIIPGNMRQTRSTREILTNRRKISSKYMSTSGSPRYECEAHACLQQQDYFNIIPSDLVYQRLENDRCDMLTKRTDPNNACMETASFGASRNVRYEECFHETQAESHIAVSGVLPTVDETDFQDPSAFTDYGEQYRGYLSSQDKDLYFREPIVMTPDKSKIAWAENTEKEDIKDAQGRHVSSADAKHCSKACTIEDDDSLSGYFQRKRRALSEGDRAQSVGRVVQLRNLYEQRQWNSQPHVTPSSRYAIDKSRTTVTNAAAKNTRNDYIQQSESVMKEHQDVSTSEGRLKEASSNQDVRGINKKHTNLRRLTVSICQNDCHEERRGKDVSQSLYSSRVTEGRTLSEYSPGIPGPAMSQRTVNLRASAGLSHNLPHTVHSSGIPQIMHHSMHSPDTHQTVFQSVHSSNISQGIYESVPSPLTTPGICGSMQASELTQSQPCPSEQKVSHLEQHARIKVHLLAAKFSGINRSELKRSATVGCSQRQDYDRKQSSCLGTDERGKLEASAKSILSRDIERTDNQTNSTTHQVIPSQKQGTDNHNMLEDQRTKDDNRSIVNSEKTEHAQELHQIPNEECEGYTVLGEQNYKKEANACGKNSTMKKMAYSPQRTDIDPSVEGNSRDVESTTTRKPSSFFENANTYFENRSNETVVSSCPDSPGVNTKSFLHWQCLTPGKDLIAGILPPVLPNLATYGDQDRRTRIPLPSTRTAQQERVVKTSVMSSPVKKPDTDPVKKTTVQQLSSASNETGISIGDVELSGSNIDICKSKVASRDQDSLEISSDKDTKRTQCSNENTTNVKTHPQLKEIKNTRNETISARIHDNPGLRTSPEKACSQRQTRQKHSLGLDPKPPTGKTGSREPSNEAKQKSRASSRHSEVSHENSQKVSGVDTDSSEPTLDIELMYSAIDESADSFNCLFIENVKYLKDMSAEGQSKPGRHEEAPGTMKRKSSFSKQLGATAASRDKKERGPSSKDTDKAHVPGHADSTSLKSVNLRTKQSSVNSINASHAGISGREGPLALLDSPRDSSTEYPTQSEADTLSMSNVSELLTSTTSDTPNSFSRALSRTQPITSKELSKARRHAKVATSLRNGSGFSSHVTEDIQKRELEVEGDSSATMESRRRRRLLENMSDQTATESSSWRSKVYQKENTNNSNPLSSQHKETPRISFRTLSALDNHTQEIDPHKESTRRRSEDSNCGDLSERLAKRRAKRLEEKRGSLSNEGSLDSQYDVERRWSRDSSVRSMDSCEAVDHEDRLSDRRSTRHNEDYLNGRRGSRNTHDSLDFAGNTDSHEDLKTKPSQRRRDSENSIKEEAYPATSEIISRKWSSKDSNFYSAESASSFRSYDDGSGINAEHPSLTLSGQQSAERQPADNSRSRRKTYQNWSEDSAFSEMKANPEDALNTNNNNDNSMITDLGAVHTSLLKHGIEDSKRQTGESSQSPLGSIQRVASDFSNTGDLQLSSQPRENSEPKGSLSLNCQNDGEMTNRRNDATCNNDNPSCGKGSPDICPQSMGTSKTGCQETAQTHLEETANRNEARESASSEVNQADVASSNLSSHHLNEKNGRRKRRTRKDKSALRKSLLNMADVPVDAEGNTEVQHDSGHSEDRPRRRQEGSFVSQHASFWEKTVPNLQNATPAKQRVNLPARYTGDKEKLTATRQKFMQNATATTETSSMPSQKPKTDSSDDVAPIKITRSFKDFNQLLQKFSGSESNSEKSDLEIGSSTVSGIPKRRSLVRRQEAKEIITTSEESDTRRTPDRTQSLKLPSRREGLKPVGHSEMGLSENNSIISTALPDASIIEKSPSFRSEFMSRRWAGRSTETSQRQKEASPLRTSEPCKVETSHAESKAVTGISPAVGGQQNLRTHSKSPASDALSQRQRPLSSGDKHPDIKTASPVHSPALLHTEATITNPAKASVTTKNIVLVDKGKSTLESKPENQAAEVHINKQVDTALKGQNSPSDLISKYNKSVTCETLTANVQPMSTSEGKRQKGTGEAVTNKQVDSSVKTAATVSLEKVTISNINIELVSEGKETVTDVISASPVVTSQSSSENKHERADGTRLTNQPVDTSVTTSAKVLLDKVKIPDVNLDTASEHKEAVADVKSASSHSSSEGKLDINATDVNVSKQTDVSVTTTKVLLGRAKIPSKNTDVISKHKESVVNAKTVTPPMATQSSSVSKHDILVTGVNVSKPAGVTASSTTKVLSEAAKSPNTYIESLTKHKEPATSSTVSAYNVVSADNSQSKLQVSKQTDAAVVNVSKQTDAAVVNVSKQTDAAVVNVSKQTDAAVVNVSKQTDAAVVNVSKQTDVAVVNVSKQTDAPIAETEQMLMDKVSEVNKNAELISKNKVKNDESGSQHVSSINSSDRKHETVSTVVNISKQTEACVAEKDKVLVDKVESLNSNVEVISEQSDPATSERSVRQHDASSNSPERKPDLHPTTVVSITSNTEADTGQAREQPVAKPRSSVERVSKPETDVTNASTTYTQSIDFRSTSSTSSLLTTSVSSSVLHSSSIGLDDTASSAGVRRAPSFKEATVTRTESLERRKGILKRNTSLNKHDMTDAAGGSSLPVIDPQLAKILMQRKQKIGDGDVIDEAEEKKDEVNELVRRPRPLSAAEEIEENLRYSAQKAAQKGLNPEEDEGLKRISVADRIYSMQNKIEEEKCAALTPKSRSGLSTPRSRPRSGFITPTQKSFDETVHQQLSMTSSVTTVASVTAAVTPAVTAVVGSNGSSTRPEEQQDRSSTAVSGPQLMEKLSKLATDSERYQEKRHRFQHRARNDWRYQTQPVTYEEIQAADSMESVSAFRALVRKRTSISAFEQITADSLRVRKHQLPPGCKTLEFPQHLTPPPRQHARRGRMLRHRTLPVTADELNAVPEHQVLVTDPEWLKLGPDGVYDSKADSGILSGSDAESLNLADSLRSLTVEVDGSETDPSRLSVTDRASIFRVLEERTKAEKDKEKSASGAKRYINRKKRERSQTMPITEEEVKTASEMGIGGSVIMNDDKTSTSEPQPEVVNRSRSSSIAEDGEKEAERGQDELAQLSLSEKVRLFSQPREPEKQPGKVEAPVVRRRNRKVASRFNTQPVTNEEVEKAAAFTRISPLAMSLVKPPDTEILKGLPLKDQRELMAQHAEMFLSQSSFRSRSGSSASLSQPSSRRASVGVAEEEARKAEEDESEKSDKKGILKDKSASTKDLHDTKSILKTEPVKAKSESEVHSILKMEVKQIVESVPVTSEPRGILKKTKSEDVSVIEGGDDIKSILKHIDSEEEECQGKPRSRSNSQPLGILKAEGLSQAGEHSAEIKSILKAPSQENVHDSQMMKSAMRRGSIESEVSVTTTTSALKSAMRTKNRSSMELGDVQTAGADSRSLSQEGDLNINNSIKHVGVSVQSSDVTVDHFSSSTHAKFTSASSTTIIKSSSGIESRTSASVSSTSSSSSSSVTTSLSNLQVPEGSEDKSGHSASDDGESSSGEILEGTPKTTKLKRKSRFSDRKAQTERYKTQPPELTESTPSSSTPADTPGRRKYKYEGRHRTQPITPDEMREAEAATPVSDLTHTPGGSIAERLNQLKTSGEEEWRKRVSRKEDILATPEVIKLRAKPGLSDHRPTSIADRLNELETSMTTWKERVEESDAKQFTVAARLPQGPTDSPLVNKLKNLPRKDEPSSRGNTPLSSPVTPTKDFIAKIPLPKDIVQDTSVVLEEIKPAAKKEEEDEKREPVTVEVPDMGEEVENFFAVKPIEEITDKVDVEVDDFNNMFIESEMILSNIHKVRPKRKVKSTSRNPLKTMSQKLEIRQEYTEVMYGTAEKELKRVKKEALAKDAGFAQAALAGLASTENFKQVELRRTDSGSSVHGQAYDPFKEPMLLHVKGRRSVQIRLVEPHTRSMNEGDCYVLVTSDKVICWEGQFANVIEKAKANEVASYIQQKKDLGCKKAAEVLTVLPLKDHLGSGKQFWATLEGEKQLQECGPDAEDELYESSIVKCNMVYRLEGNALLPYQEYWGAIPKHEMLKKNEVIIFDFGTEFYVWQGKAVSMEQRRLGMKLSKQLYEKGYNYTESPLNPMSPLRSEDCGGLPLNSPTRPSWAIFGKVNQNMETILFREKFADWPDSSRLIGVRGLATQDSFNKDLLELKPFDAKKMIPINTAPVTLKLEGANVGRGVKWSEDMQGFVKEQDIITLDVTVWHVLEYEHYKLPELSHGQFHDGDTYVVRWQYMIANANMRSLKGSAARNSLTGRERCAYFFWQGNESTINEKGASALMTVELDEERGPQIRVLQGKEPPCFLNLFDGKMIVHTGKREEPSTNSQGSWRLYCLRGDYENEVYLLEIPVSIEHLRSRSSMVLLNVKTGIVYIWHGAKSPKHVRELCVKTVNKLKEKTPLEVGLHDKATITVIEVEEGEEKREIWSALDQQDRAVYNSLLKDPKPYSHTIRLFHMSSVSLVFEVQEQLNPARVPDLVTPFPFLQSDLYKATQPALFLIDNDFEVYLWQGWWPIGSEDTENVHTGSAIARFNLDRRLAMETTLNYCKEKNPRKPPTAYLVCAGVEPVSFTSLFPFWEEDSTVKEIAAEEKKTPGYMEKVSEILQRLTQTRYTLAELQVRPLPEGVDPLKLETYLQDAEFEEILEMRREDFYAQPHWKQIEMKKNMGLF